MAYINQQTRRTMSPRARKKGQNGFSRFSIVVYVALLVMVVHLMTSNGDPVEKNSQIKGKTSKTKASSKVAIAFDGRIKKEASYRMTEHSEAVAGIAQEQDQIYLNRQRPKSSDDNNSDNTVKESPPLLEAHNEIEEKSSEINLSSTGNSDESEKMGFEAENSKTSGDESEGDDENSFDGMTSEDVAENVNALKASVQQVLMRLRDAAFATIEVQMADTVSPAMEKYRTTISTLMTKLSKTLFRENDAIRLRAEEMVYLRFKVFVLRTFEEQVDLWIAQTSDDIDNDVADFEEKELNVLEIDEELDTLENSRYLPELYDAIEMIAVELLRTDMRSDIADLAKDATQGIVDNLGQNAEVILDDDETYLDMNPPLIMGALPTEEDVFAAIEDGNNDDDSVPDEEDDTEGEQDPDVDTESTEVSNEDADETGNEDDMEDEDESNTGEAGDGVANGNANSTMDVVDSSDYLTMGNGTSIVTPAEEDSTDNESEATSTAAASNSIVIASETGPIGMPVDVSTNQDNVTSTEVERNAGDVEETSANEGGGPIGMPADVTNQDNVTSTEVEMNAGDVEETSANEGVGPIGMPADVANQENVTSTEAERNAGDVEETGANENQDNATSIEAKSNTENVEEPSGNDGGGTPDNRITSVNSMAVDAESTA